MWANLWPSAGCSKTFYRTAGGLEHTATTLPLNNTFIFSIFSSIFLNHITFHETLLTVAHDIINDIKNSCLTFLTGYMTQYDLFYLQRIKSSSMNPFPFKSAVLGVVTKRNITAISIRIALASMRLIATWKSAICLTQMGRNINITPKGRVAANMVKIWKDKGNKAHTHVYNTAGFKWN